jgi:hypothetical protein
MITVDRLCIFNALFYFLNSFISGSSTFYSKIITERASQKKGLALAFLPYYVNGNTKKLTSGIIRV